MGSLLFTMRPLYLYIYFCVCVFFFLVFGIMDLNGARNALFRNWDCDFFTRGCSYFLFFATSCDGHGVRGPFPTWGCLNKLVFFLDFCQGKLWLTWAHHQSSAATGKQQLIIFVTLVQISYGTPDVILHCSNRTTNLITIYFIAFSSHSSPVACHCFNRWQAIM